MQFILKLLNQLMPRQCYFCHIETDNGLNACGTCIALFPLASQHCQACNKLTTAGEKHCSHCQGQTSAIEFTHVPYLYQGPVSTLITNLKFNHELLHAHLLGNLLVHSRLQQPEPLPQLLLPLPLHIERLKERGFNQALEIARPIAKRLNIPIDYRSVIRHKNTRPQTSLNRNARQKNVKNAFSVERKLSGLHVAIIDDVITTGATIKSFAKALQAQGVAKIEVWCCARGVPSVE